MKMDKTAIADVASKLKFRTQAFINGKFVHYGAQAGIATPYNSTLRSLVKGIESGMGK